MLRMWHTEPLNQSLKAQKNTNLLQRKCLLLLLENIKGYKGFYRFATITTASAVTVLKEWETERLVGRSKEFWGILAAAFRVWVK